MKIAIFTDTYPPQINGVATSARNLFKTLKNHGQDVVVVTTNPFDTEFSFEDGVMRIPGLEIKKLYGYIGAWLWNSAAMIDDMDAKMNILDKAYEGVEPGQWTQKIFTMDSRYFYLPLYTKKN